jgi:PadR family transcriptional regulator PadR
MKKMVAKKEAGNEDQVGTVNKAEPGAKVDLLLGTLEMLILQILTAGPQHGFGVARRFREITDDSLDIEDGTLYPALYRMERRGLITAQWRVTENKRRAKYYHLTDEGRRHLRAENERWHSFVGIVAKVLQTTW